MFMLYLNWVLFFLILFQVSSISLPEDAIYLLRFRKSLSRPSQDLLPWNLTSHCQWTGVSCYPNNNHVKSLNLSDFGIIGMLNDSVVNLCHLPHLLSLDLSGNSFTGSIPPQFGNCSQLEAIFLNGNGITGPIPPDIFNSKQLLQLNLGSNFLSGTVPPEVGLCTKLEFLELYNNSLTGKIPGILFSLPSLILLDLSTNNLTGGLPDFPSSCSISELWIHENGFSASLPLTLGNCKNLSVFYASYNSLGGTIPPDVMKGLSQLELLYLNNNNLEGEIPETLWGFSNLQEIVLSANRLDGRISENITRCHRLSIIALSDNNLINQIPSSIGNLKNLNTLILSNNMLNGSIPSELGNCSSLVSIELQNNFIGGTIPPQICNLQILEIFHAFNNQIEGQIPRQFGRLSNLVKLALYNNSLTGTIPDGITNLTSLTFLSLAHNDLTGEVPPELGKSNSPGLGTLDLTGNRFYGSIPSGICTGNSLTVLTIGNNRFNGTFPVEIGKCNSLRRVILSNNLLQSNIPADLHINNKISYLEIRGNLLMGQIPSIFGFWSSLAMLDISENMFSGSIPPELGNLQNLEILKISSNRLNGSIPPGLGNCTKMSKLDLSGNSLSGSIPPEIITNVNLQSLMFQNNKLSGFLPDSFSSSQSLFELNLGNNMIEGSIPCTLSKLHHFNSVLNLSHNKLSGEIPKCLGNLDKLEILDLSSNSLSDGIPSELNNMMSISFVNISFNNLSGKVPDTWLKIMSSYPESFLGNSELCFLGSENISCGEERRIYHKRGRILAPLIIGVVLSVTVLSLAAYLLVVRGLQNRYASMHSILRDSLSRMEDLPEDLTFNDIIRATEGSSDTYVLGRGKHGTVYRTVSMKSGKHWAVKKVDLSETNSSSEMRTLSMVRHRNVVKIVGYCINDGKGFIVTELMPNGTLFDALHRSKPHITLEWEARYWIALGIAQGLSYLHHDCVPQIIHRDVKSDNVLLDSDMEPKIGDFGTAKLVCDLDESETRSAIVGTLGYIAPENGYSTRLTEKCDVYSYGVILLELLCRKLPVDPSFEEGLDIASWIRKNLQETDDCFCFLDGEIQLWDVDEQLKALKLLDLALQCTEQVPEERPSMREVVGTFMKLNAKSERCVGRKEST